MGFDEYIGKVNDVFGLKELDNAGQNKPEVIIVNDSEVHSLSELKKVLNEMDSTSTLKYLIKSGKLYKWLSQHCYEEEADKVQKINVSDENWLKEAAIIFDLPYNSLSKTIQHEDEDYLKRKKKLEELAGKDKDKLPSNLNIVATTQEELAALINAGEEMIYLCKGEFNIPIGKSGITYKCIAKPTIENAYTKDLYSKAGIQIVYIELPNKVEPDREKYAMEKAISNGYDIFYDDHNPLACKVYKNLHDTTYRNFYRLRVDRSVALGKYGTESGAKNAISSALKSAYTKASNLFDTNSKECIAKEIVVHYTMLLQKFYGDFKDTLTEFCEVNGFGDEIIQIEKIISSCTPFLEHRLKEELNDNRYYYDMYDFSYFVNKVDVVDFEPSIETSVVMSFLEKALSDNENRYGISSDLFEAYMEMEEDVNEKAQTLHNAAKDAFNELVDGLVSVFEIIGKDLPVSDKDETIADYLKKEMRKSA